MAITLGVTTLPAARRVLTTPGVLTRLTLPPGVAGMQVSVYAEGPSFLTYCGTDGAPAGEAVRIPMVVDNWLELDQLGADLFVGSAGEEPVGATFNFAVWRGVA